MQKANSEHYRLARQEKNSQGEEQNYRGQHYLKEEAIYAFQEEESPPSHQVFVFGEIQFPNSQPENLFEQKMLKNDDAWLEPTPFTQFNSFEWKGLYSEESHILVSQIQLLTPYDNSKQITAVIISFNNGHSYDSIFKAIQQKNRQNNQIVVYSCSTHSIFGIYQGLKGQPCQQIIKDMINSINKVPPECVAFNWECDHSYLNQKFPQGKEQVLKLLKIILDSGHMAMFSDFSLKALINQWDSSILGTNPFVRIGQTSDQIVLRFKPQVLKKCPSAQLQAIGYMAEDNFCYLHTLGATILYSVDQTKINKNAYELILLTINETHLPQHQQYILQIDGIKGTAGHVLLKYKSGGCLLTSMGHWSQLMKLQTSEEKVFHMAETIYDHISIKKIMKMVYSSMNSSNKKQYLRSESINFIQTQPPCSNKNITFLN